MNPVFIPETDPVTVYNPAPGEPGSLPNYPYLVTYNIVTVPEPNALALATLGGGLLLFTFKGRLQATT